MNVFAQLLIDPHYDELPIFASFITNAASQFGSQNEVLWFDARGHLRRASAAEFVIKDHSSARFRQLGFQFGTPKLPRRFFGVLHLASSMRWAPSSYFSTDAPGASRPRMMSKQAERAIAQGRWKDYPACLQITLAREPESSFDQACQTITSLFAGGDLPWLVYGVFDRGNDSLYAEFDTCNPEIDEIDLQFLVGRWPGIYPLLSERIDQFHPAIITNNVMATQMLAVIAQQGSRFAISKSKSLIVFDPKTFDSAETRECFRPIIAPRDNSTAWP